MGEDPKTAARPAGLNPGQRVILYDGVCELCAAWSRFFIKRDPQIRVKLCALQSDEGQAILRHLGMDTEGFDTMIYLQDGRAYLRSSAALRAIGQLPHLYKLAFAGLILPPFIRDALYKVIAGNRYKWFGKHDVCVLPTPEVRAHFLRASEVVAEDEASVKG